MISDVTRVEASSIFENCALFLTKEQYLNITDYYYSAETHAEIFYVVVCDYCRGDSFLM